jgi:hypothetical protein
MPRSGWSRRNRRRRRRCGTGRARGTRRWCRSGRPGRSGSSRKGSGPRRREGRTDSAARRCLAGHHPAARAPMERRDPCGHPRPTATREARRRTASCRAWLPCLDRRWPRSSPNLPTGRSRSSQPATAHS